jgi:hypothetical protein
MAQVLRLTAYDVQHHPTMCTNGRHFRPSQALRKPGRWRQNRGRPEGSTYLV